MFIGTYSPDDTKDDMCTHSNDPSDFRGLWRGEVRVEIWVRYTHPTFMCLVLWIIKLFHL